MGHTTLIRGEGELKVGQGPVRTGVTVILPRGKRSIDPVFAGWFSLNGNGEMTGTTWVEESGFMEGPMAITNTHSVGVVRDAIIAWEVQHGLLRGAFALPVVAETNDGWLNDINGFHVKPEHVFQALESASAGPVPEGNVGGGTGMHCYDFKGGTGTASRKLPAGGRRIHRRRAGAGELRHAPAPAGGGRAGRVKKSVRQISLPQRRPSGARRPRRIDHHCGGHGRAGHCASTETPGAAGGARNRPHRGHVRQRFRGHLHCFLDGQPRAPTRCPMPPRSVCSPTAGSTTFSRPPFLRPKRRLLTRWSRPKR